MKDLKKEFQIVVKELKLLTRKVENLTTSISHLPVPKMSGKSKSTGETTDQKVSKITAADEVFGIIKKSRKGTTTDLLKKKTGFNDKKIQNIVYKLKKQGKIKSESKGFYVAV